MYTENTLGYAVASAEQAAEIRQTQLATAPHPAAGRKGIPLPVVLGLAAIALVFLIRRR